MMMMMMMMIMMMVMMMMMIMMIIMAAAFNALASSECLRMAQCSSGVIDLNQNSFELHHWFLVNVE